MNGVTKSISVGVLCLTLFSCAAPSPQEKDEAFKDKLRQEVADEVTVGREISAKLLGRFGNCKEPVTREYVNLVGQSLAQESGRPELKFRFAVLNSDEANAYAAPGGYIFVTKGLLKSLQNESELSVVLAHEIAHVNEKHMYTAIMPKKGPSAAETVARLFTRGYGDLGASLSKIIDAGLAILLEEGYGKEKEFAADQAGASYAAAAGYDGTALVTVIQRLEKAAHNEVLAKTHPPFTERIKILEKYLVDNGLSKGDRRLAVSVLRTRFDRARQSLETWKQ